MTPGPAENCTAAEASHAPSDAHTYGCLAQEHADLHQIRRVVPVTGDNARERREGPEGGGEPAAEALAAAVQRACDEARAELVLHTAVEQGRVEAWREHAAPAGATQAWARARYDAERYGRERLEHEHIRLHGDDVIGEFLGPAPW